MRLVVVQGASAYSVPIERLHRVTTANGPIRLSLANQELETNGSLADALRVGAPALSIPVGLSQALPVVLEFDALPGNDSELLGLAIAV